MPPLRSWKTTSKCRGFRPVASSLAQDRSVEYPAADHHEVVAIEGVALAPVSLLRHSHPPTFRVELILAAGCDNNERAR